MRGITVLVVVALASVLVGASSLSLASPVPEWELPRIDEYCEGRMFCTRETPEHRSCVVFDGILDLSKFPPVTTGLDRARPASFSHGAFLMRCDAAHTPAPPRPVLSNAFGATEGLAFGDIEVGVADPAEQCWHRKGDRPHFPTSCLDVPANHSADPLRAALACSLAEMPTVTVVLNRDMDGNIFHSLFNTAFALFKTGVSLGINMSAPSTAAFMFDVNPLSRGDRELLTTLFGVDNTQGTRFQHWVRRPIPAREPFHRLCQHAMVLGANRHWRSWLATNHSYSQTLMRPFAQWVRAAFDAPLADAPSLVTIVERVGTRAISNLDALMAALAAAALPEGVTVRRVRMEELTLKEQLQLVGATRVFVAVHGAALAFIPFLPPSSAVVELIPYAHPDPAFFSRISSMAAVGHVSVEVDAALQPQAVLDAKAPYASPMVCDVARVVNEVTKALK